MSKNLYKMANVYVNNLTKSARHFDEERLFREEDPEDAYVPEEERDLEEEELESELEEAPFELGEGKFEDFAPEIKDDDDEQYQKSIYSLMEPDTERMDMDELSGDYKKDTDYKFENEPEEKKDRLQSLIKDWYNEASFKSPVIKMAVLYSKAEKGTEGAFFEGLEDLPEEEESVSLKETLSDPGVTDPENIEQAELWEHGRKEDEPSDTGDIEPPEEEAGDPGEFMPLTDEEADAEGEMRRKRLELIKQRHQAYLDDEIETEEADKEELEPFETGPGHDEDILSGLEDEDEESEEEAESEPEFEDEE